MVILYTPATGFPDLEVKIAYGLARVGIEAGYEVEILPQRGFYQVCYKKYLSTKAVETFLMLLQRFLSSDRFFDLGVKAKDKTKYSADEEVIDRIRDNNIDLIQVFSKRDIFDFNIKRNLFCGHDKFHKFGGSSGLILLSSFHAGKPYYRDKRFDTFNLGLCEICGYLAVLGLYSFGFNIQMGKGKNRKYVIVLPVPEKKITTKNIQILLSLQKTLHNFWLSDLQPLRTFFIGLLAKVPSLSDIVNELRLTFHLSLLSKDNRGDTVVEQTTFINALPFSKFISDSSYNSATVVKLLDDKDLPKVSALIEITNILEDLEKENLPKFARLYALETTPKDSNKWTSLLYPETAKYLLKEVGMIKQEIIESPAILSLARTLRYFIRERKYGYADDIRNARKESRDFEETIAKMLREGRLRLEQDKMIHLPAEDEIKEVFRFAHEDFESTKLALVILAFSFSSRAEETQTEEIQNEE